MRSEFDSACSKMGGCFFYRRRQQKQRARKKPEQQHVLSTSSCSNTVGSERGGTSPPGSQVTTMAAPAMTLPLNPCRPDGRPHGRGPICDSDAAAARNTLWHATNGVGSGEDK